MKCALEKKCVRCGNAFIRPYGISATQWKKRSVCSVQCIRIRLEPIERLRRRDERAKLYYKKNKEHIKIYGKQYRKDNKIKLRNLLNKRRKENINLRISNLLRNRIGQVIRRKQQKSRGGSAVRDLGCSVKELRFYLEGKFQDGMTWENWGTYGWHIDHVIPLSFFNLSDREQFLKACHYTNLQPLWAVDNYKKAKKVSYV